MKKTLATIAILMSIPLLVLGVIFLIAATTSAGRLPVAAVFLVIGGGFLAWGALTLRRLAEISPEALSTDIVDLARRLGGEVTVAQVQSEFRVSNNLALSVLEKMRGQGQGQREQRTDHDVYVFKSVMPAKAIKRCPYCGSEFAVKSAMRDCPNCGGALEIVKD